MSLKEEIQAIHEEKELEPWIYVGYRLIGDVRNNSYRLVLRYVRRIFNNGDESMKERYVRHDFASHKQALAAVISAPKQITPEEVKK